MTHPTKQKLLDAGAHMVLEQGYHALGIQSLLEKTGIPKGSFYHHFDSKQDFVLEIVEMYMAEVHQALDACLEDETRPALDRVRGFFEMTRTKYREEGYLGCLLGGLGQELSGASEVFQRRIERCLSEIAERIAACLDEGVGRGELPEGTDTRAMADLLVDCWEGAALRSRLRRNPAPLDHMLDFYFRAAAPEEPAQN
jgi:TetR/AcrR family transcriptional repressor of nem operon